MKMEKRKTRPLREGTVVWAHARRTEWQYFLQISIWLNETARRCNVFEIAMFYAFTVNLLF